MKFTSEDIAFMEGLNSTELPAESRIYLTSQHGYIRNLDRDKLKGLEAIYQRVFNLPKFALCYTCNSDVMAMVLGLYRELDKQPSEIVPLQEVLPKSVNPVKVKLKDKDEA